MATEISDEQMIELLSAAEEIADGWYSVGRIDWDDFLYRLEAHTDIDLGSDMCASHIQKIQQHVRTYRRS